MGTAASFNAPGGIAVDPSSGTLYVADQYNHRIRMITTAGVVTTISGTGTGAFLDGAAATAAFNLPTHLTMDRLGNLFVSDRSNYRIRMLQASTWYVTTWAGYGSSTFQDGAPTSAGMNEALGLCTSGTSLFFVDQ